MIEDQDRLAGKVRFVHVVPSGLVMALVLPLATAQNTVPFHAMSIHPSDTGSVRCVHVVPSGEVAQ